jgi:Rps23 Pro-64 3,4-dihydroxylase Tpa1-like proline 4-hydroxylase
LEDENNGTANNKRAAEARKIHFKREVDDWQWEKRRDSILQFQIGEFVTVCSLLHHEIIKPLDQKHIGVKRITLRPSEIFFFVWK